MRVRTGKVIRATSLLGQANVPNVLTSSNKNFIPAISSTTKNFYLGGGINVGYSFNIVNGHKYFMALRIKDMTSTNVDYRRFALWDKTNNAYLNYPTTTVQDNDIFIAKYDSSISTEVYNTFQCHYTVDGVTGTPCWWIFIDLTTLGLDTLTAQQFYNKYKDKLELLATGEEITIDRGSGKVGLKENNSSYYTNNLPSAYQELEYIESTGKQSIALGYNATQDTEFEITFMRTGNTGDSNQWILAGYNDGGVPQCTITHNSARFKDSDSNGINYSISIDIGTKYTATYHSKEFILNGTSYGTTPSQNSFTTQNFTLFDAGRGSALRFPFIGRIYSCKVWSNSSTLVRNMIPCYRKADHEPGMYDLVNDVFYTDKYNGSEKFRLGYNFQSCNVIEKMYGYNQIVSQEVQGNVIGGTLSLDESTNIYTYTFGDTVGHTNWNHYMCFVMSNSSYNENHQYMSFVKIKHAKKLRVYNYPLTTFDVNQDGSNDWQIVGGIRTGSKYTMGSLFYFQFIDCDTNGWLPGESFQFMPITTIDLTDWYGPGKEPTTVAEFKEKFSKDYYGFCPNKIRLTEKQINALPVYGYNQLASINRDVSNGLTALFNSLTNRVNISGKSIANSTYLKLCDYFNSTIDHKYYVSVTGNNVGNGSAFLPTLHPTNLINNPKIITANTTMTNAIIRFNLPNGESINTDVIVQIIDLTDWYGAGSEPTTVAEFKATFPHKYYQYMKKSLLNRYMINKLIS